MDWLNLFIRFTAKVLQVIIISIVVIIFFVVIDRTPYESIVRGLRNSKHRIVQIRTTEEDTQDRDGMYLEIDYGKKGRILVREDDNGIMVNPMDLTPTPREQ